MKKLFIKKLLPIAICAAISVCLTACTPSSEDTDDTQTDTATTYEIGICTDDNSPYSTLVVQGYKDALTDNFGEDSVVFIEQNASMYPTASTAVETVLSAGVDDIFVYGDGSLTAASELTSALPIIFAGVYNYEDVLHIVSDGRENSTLNVTGITSVPSIDEQVSLMIEAADHHPSAVGILYDPTDTESIIQNETFERYLDEAGIAWKEYELSNEPESENADSDNDDEEATEADTVILPSVSAAASGKEGANIHVESIGDGGYLTGINEPMSARTPQISALWIQPEELEDANDEDEADSADDSESATEESVLETAFNECDCIYICQDNELADSESIMKQMRLLAEETSTVTVGGDEIIGEYTLVSLYEDPYDIGYRCGKKSIDILTGEKTVDTISIDNPSRSKTTKLYDNDLSTSLNKEWPKTFYEHDDYLETYEPGSLTDRIETE